MKEHRHTLLEDYYFDVLRVVVEAFQNAGYNPILVGGAAVQIHLIDLVGFENAEEYLRKTDDYDMVIFGINDEEVRDVINTLNGSYFATENAAFLITVQRNGAKRPVLKVEYLNSEGEIKNEEIHVNISTKSDDLNHIYPKRAEFMYGDAVEIKIKHSRTLSELKVRVLRIEDLIATKITAGRDKDYVDVQNLIESVRISGRALDWARIKENVRSTKTDDSRIRATRYVRDLERGFGNKPAMILK
ncbi:MAG: hypothetical protein QXL47_01675 [Candidatus Anstonellales archaeon]